MFQPIIVEIGKIVLSFWMVAILENGGRRNFARCIKFNPRKEPYKTLGFQNAVEVKGQEQNIQILVIDKKGNKLQPRSINNGLKFFCEWPIMVRAINHEAGLEEVFNAFYTLDQRGNRIFQVKKILRAEKQKKEEKHIDSKDIAGQQAGITNGNKKRSRSDETDPQAKKAERRNLTQKKNGNGKNERFRKEPNYPEGFFTDFIQQQRIYEKNRFVQQS